MSDEPYDYGELVVLQHQDDVPLDNLTPVLEGRSGRRPYRIHHLGNGDPVPELHAGIRGVLVLGGSMGLPDAERPDWMIDEMAFLAGAVAGEIPVFGICLGCQLLASALGGTVARRDTPEVGFYALGRTEAADDDTVFAGWPAGGGVLMVHEDQVTELPDGATPMLSGSDGVAAWRAYDGRSYGVQFHPEVSAATLDAWAAKERLQGLLRTAGYETEAILEEFRQREPFIRSVGVSLVGRWIDQVVGAGDPSPRKHAR